VTACITLVIIPSLIDDVFSAYRREPWAVFSTHTCWQHLLGITRQQSKDHGVLADVFGSTMTSRLSDIVDDSKRIFVKVIV